MNINQVSLPYFFAMLTPLVVVPTVVGAVLVWIVYRFADRDLLHSPTCSSARPSTARSPGPAPGQPGRGRLGLWSTGLAGVVLGFLSCAGWLAWTVGSDGGVIPPALPAPNQSPTWQIIACGTTVAVVTLLVSVSSRHLVSGAFASPLGTAAGFTTAFTLDAASMTPSQQPVGVLMSMVGFSLGLGALACGVALVRLAVHRRRNPPPPLTSTR